MTTGAWPGSRPTGRSRPRRHDLTPGSRAPLPLRSFRTRLPGDPEMTSSGESDQPEFSLDAVRREGLLARSGAEPVAHDGTGRVQLSFTVEDKEAPPAHKQVRVPPGVSVFDSASWNGIAIDSTCGGHGTCHKGKVRVDVRTPVSRHDRRTFTRDQLEEGWRLACLVRATRDHEVLVPPLTTRPKAATVGVG